VRRRRSGARCWLHQELVRLTGVTHYRPAAAVSLHARRGGYRRRARSPVRLQASDEASSGRVQRHRLDRGGNRQLNAAFYRIAITQARIHLIATERNVAEARSAEIEELVLRLDELASPG
jgi:transposase